VSSAVCAACTRSIDAAAKLCPYCGADPQTGEREDTQALLQEVFQPKTLTTSESVLEYARQRQGIVIGVSIVVGLLVLAGIHQFVTMRNASAVTDSPAVPLTEITDIADLRDDAAPVPMGELDFPYDGRPQTMRTFIVERGAIAPVAPMPVPPPAPGAGGAAGAPAAGIPARPTAAGAAAAPPQVPAPSRPPTR
jgi:hypothetical protein